MSWEAVYRLRSNGTTEPDRVVNHKGETVCEGFFWHPNAEKNIRLVELAPEMKVALHTTLQYLKRPFNDTQKKELICKIQDVLKKFNQ